MSITTTIRNQGLKVGDFDDVIAATNDGESVEHCEHGHGVGNYEAKEICRVTKKNGVVYALLSEYSQHHLHTTVHSLSILKFDGYKFVVVQYWPASLLDHNKSRRQHFDEFMRTVV